MNTLCEFDVVEGRIDRGFVQDGRRRFGEDLVNASACHDIAAEQEADLLVATIGAGRGKARVCGVVHRGRVPRACRVEYGRWNHIARPPGPPAVEWSKRLAPLSRVALPWRTGEADNALRHHRLGRGMPRARRAE